jgi:NAD(P)H-hydrate repair Nnr-like enzyme with NAD(P)H-hydrate dehydratase domain
MNKIYQNELLFPEIIWERPVHYYKHHGGRIFIIAGSQGGANKASIVCEAVFRSGTGVITLGFPDILKNVYKDFLPEQMTLALPSTPGGTISQKSAEQIAEQEKVSDVIMIGPGISENAETVHLTWDIIIEAKKPVVVCSDAVSAFIKGVEVIRSKEDEKFLIDFFTERVAPLILTLTPEELLKIIAASKFSDYPKPNIAFVKKHKEQLAAFLAQSFSAIVVINDDGQIIADSERLLINPSKIIGEKISSDILSAVVASFVGQNPDKIFESASTAGYLLLSAMELAKQKLPEKIIMSSDAIRELPSAIKLAESK